MDSPKKWVPPDNKLLLSDAVPGISLLNLPFRCPMCSAELEILASKMKFSRPILLNCSHYVCESCARQKGISVAGLKCPECSKVTLYSSKDFRLQLIHHIYLNGLQSYNRTSLKKRIEFYMNNSKTSTGNVENRDLCIECSIGTDLLFCRQCDHPYCHPCFNIVHKSGKVFKTHKYISIDESNKKNYRAIISETVSGMTSIFCRRHKTHECNYYCLDCKLPCCLLCNKEQHIEHKMSTVRKENEKRRPQLDNIIKLLKAAIVKTETASKDTETHRMENEKNAIATIHKIGKHFIHLHGFLQLLENSLINDVKSHYAELDESMNSMESALKETLKMCSNELKKFESYRHKMPTSVFISSAIYETQTFLTNSSYVDFHGRSSNPFKFVELKSFEEEIKTFYKVSLDTMSDKIQPEEQKLLLSDHSKQLMLANNRSSEMSIEAEEDIENDDTRNEFDVDISSSQVEIGCDVTYSSIGTDRDETKTPTPKEKKKKKSQNKKTKKTEDLTFQTVHVSNIVSAVCFYVQYQSFLRNVPDFIDLCNQEGSSGVSPEGIEQNKMYLVHHITDNNYYRAFVLNTKNQHRDMYFVLFVDYGTTGDIHRTRFRPISQYLANEPYGAHKCSLYNVLNSPNTPKDEVIQMMSDIIANQNMSIIVLNETKAITYCDLITQVDVNVSVRDALVFAGMVKVNDNNQTISAEKLYRIEELKRCMLYEKSARPFFKETYLPEQLFRVSVTHIETPHEFYVTKSSQNQDYHQMSEQLNTFYNGSNSNRFILYPVIGMPCAIKCSKWCRAEIIQILPEQNCEVFLVDVGSCRTVKYRHLKYLDSDFLKMSQAAIRCRLHDIHPNKADNYRWNETSITKFKQYCMTTKLQIHIVDFDDVNEIYNVNLFYMKGSRDVCINNLLMNVDNCESSALESSKLSNIGQHTAASSKNVFKRDVKNFLAHVSMTKPSSSPQSKSNGQTFKRSKIIIQCIFSPSEFYISFEKFRDGMTKLHRNLQLMMRRTPDGKNPSHQNKETWCVGEKCIVFTKLSEHDTAQYYRGTIREIMPDGLNSVTLSDFGHVVVVDNMVIYESSESINEIVDGAIRCYLSSVSPTSGETNWTTSAKEAFRSMIENYEELAVTLHGVKRFDSSFSVILWGLKTKCDDALSPIVYVWENVNQNLVDLGLAHLLQKFDRVFDPNETVQVEKEIDFDIYEGWLEKIDNFFSGNSQMDQENGVTAPEFELYDDDQFADDVTKIKQWLPPERPTKSVFVGIPTYVDNNAVIYIHDITRNAILDKMRRLINQRCQQSKPDVGAVWRRGEPCLARFHIDGSFYRGTVVDNLEATLIKVEFIDYGNIEECHPYDLRKDVILGNIPPQCGKFCLSNIRPIDGTPKWSTQHLDFIHAQIVGAICNVRVDVNSSMRFESVGDIIPCSITFENIDLARLLIEKKIAEMARNWNFIEGVDKAYDPFSHAINIKNKIIKRKKETGGVDRLRRNTQILSYNEYQDVFSDININKNNTDDNSPKYNVDANETALTTAATTDPDHTLAATTTLTTMDKLNDDQCELSFNGDDFETSTQITTTLNIVNECLPFDSIVVAEDTHGFNADVTKIITPLDLYISPLFENHIDRCNQMMNTVQLFAMKALRVTSITPGTPCIALDRRDEKPLWYRGIIQSYEFEPESFTVLLVDTLEVAKFKKNDVRKCPMELRKFPLRNIKVQLTGIKCNPRLRFVDITKQLTAVIGDTKVYVKIVKDIESVTLVKLYKDSKCNELAYESLIYDKFYIEKK